MNSDFFKEEVREGFCISAEMKKVWAVEMKVLSFVISVCKKYDIPYFADYGTLLGTVDTKASYHGMMTLTYALNVRIICVLLKHLRKKIIQIMYIMDFIFQIQAVSRL